MSSQIPDDAQAFFDVANRFVGLANELSGEHGHARVAAAMLWAASRYGAFAWARSGAPGKQSPQDALDLFEAQYRKMMEDNLASVLGNFTAPPDP